MISDVGCLLRRLIVAAAAGKRDPVCGNQHRE
jgi:hypothetical protein